jgi:hypothetical protein
MLAHKLIESLEEVDSPDAANQWIEVAEAARWYNSQSPGLGDNLRRALPDTGKAACGRARAACRSSVEKAFIAVLAADRK